MDIKAEFNRLKKLRKQSRELQALYLDLCRRSTSPSCYGTRSRGGRTHSDPTADAAIREMQASRVLDKLYTVQAEQMQLEIDLLDLMEGLDSDKWMVLYNRYWKEMQYKPLAKTLDISTEYCEKLKRLAFKEMDQKRNAPTE